MTRPWKRPQCEAQISDHIAKWRSSRGEEECCSFHARFKIENKRLCSRHAGLFVLRLLKNNNVGRIAIEELP